MQLGKALIRFLQSFKRGSNMRLREEGLVSKCTRTLASSSILILRMSNCRANERPSLWAQSSVVVLDILPSFLMNLATQSPLLSCNTPPPPTFLGFPKTAPSVLSFTQPGKGFFQLT